MGKDGLMFGGLYLGHAYYGASPIGEIVVEITNPDIDGTFIPRYSGRGGLAVSLIDEGSMKRFHSDFGEFQASDPFGETLLKKQEAAKGSFIRKA